MTPLRSLRSLKLKLGLVILVAIVVTAATSVIAVRAGLPSLMGAAAGITLALGCAQLLARGTTAPLREMATVAAAMARGERGRPVRVTSDDEVGELARAFNRMTEELAETDRLRRDFVANVSHELRTPIAALQALLENLVEGVSEPDPATLATMLVQTRRLGRLVTQLLDLSRMEAGEQPFDIRPCELRQVLEVADDGPGIATQELERVFERFHSGDGARGVEAGGTGLGLAISRWIVELHGGTIHAEQRDPQGCRIVVTLPTVDGH